MELIWRKMQHRTAMEDRVITLSIRIILSSNKTEYMIRKPKIVCGKSIIFKVVERIVLNSEFRLLRQ